MTRGVACALLLALTTAASAQAPAASPGHTAADMADLRSLTELRATRADLARPQTPVYYLLFADEAAARAARRSAEDEGFATLRLTPARANAGWILVLARKMPLTPDTVLGASRSLQSIAAKYQGRYGGWEAQPRS